jgi:hypothetical protein
MEHEVDSTIVDIATSEQLERARGAFELQIVVAPRNEAEFHTLRRALRMSRADIPWLREHTPGVVRRGAEVDLRLVLQRVKDAGHSAVLQPRDESEPVNIGADG